MIECFVLFLKKTVIRVTVRRLIKDKPQALFSLPPCPLVHRESRESPCVYQAGDPERKAPLPGGHVPPRPIHYVCHRQRCGAVFPHHGPLFPTHHGAFAKGTTKLYVSLLAFDGISGTGHVFGRIVVHGKFRSEKRHSATVGLRANTDKFHFTLFQSFHCGKGGPSTNLSRIGWR